MKFIACIDSMGGLGHKGDLLFHIKEDMKRFKELTTGGVVMMGYNTYKSLPHGALPNRLNIVMTRNHVIEEDGVVTMGSRGVLMQYLAENNINPDDVWVIGGAKIFRDFLPDCHEMFLTRVAVIHQSDCFYPCPEMISGWKQDSEEEHYDDNVGLFQFEHYVRR